MMNFGRVNFSERHSEEVMFLLTLSVYPHIISKTTLHGGHLKEKLPYHYLKHNYVVNYSTSSF